MIWWIFWLTQNLQSERIFFKYPSAEPYNWKEYFGLIVGMFHILRNLRYIIHILKFCTIAKTWKLHMHAGLNTRWMLTYSRCLDKYHKSVIRPTINICRVKFLFTNLKVWNALSSKSTQPARTAQHFGLWTENHFLTMSIRLGNSLCPVKSVSAQIGLHLQNKTSQ